MPQNQDLWNGKPGQSLYITKSLLRETFEVMEDSAQKNNQQEAGSKQTCHLLLHATCLANSLTLKIEEVYPSKTLVNFCQPMLDPRG
jgi:hypothetical protein